MPLNVRISPSVIFLLLLTLPCATSDCPCFRFCQLTDSVRTTRTNAYMYVFMYVYNMYVLYVCSAVQTDCVISPTDSTWTRTLCSTTCSMPELTPVNYTIFICIITIIIIIIIIITDLEFFTGACRHGSNTSVFQEALENFLTATIVLTSTLVVLEVTSVT